MHRKKNLHYLRLFICTSAVFQYKNVNSGHDFGANKTTASNHGQPFCVVYCWPRGAETESFKFGFEKQKMLLKKKTELKKLEHWLFLFKKCLHLQS